RWARRTEAARTTTRMHGLRCWLLIGHGLLLRVASGRAAVSTLCHEYLRKAATLGCRSRGVQDQSEAARRWLSATGPPIAARQLQPAICTSTVAALSSGRARWVS